MNDDLKERLSVVESSLLSMGITMAYLEQEKRLLQACIQNPSEDNLKILANYTELIRKFFMGLASGGPS